MVLDICALFLGFAILVGGAEFLIKGASSLAMAMGITPLIIGLTVVAFGTSTPELAVSVNAALTGTPDVALGNVVGSNICNIFLIIGISAMLAAVKINRAVQIREMPLMLLTLALLWIVALSGGVGRIEGALLFFGIVLYLGYTFYVIKTKPGHEALEEIEGEVLEQSTEQRTSLCVAYILAGLVGMVFGSDWIVTSATKLALSFKVSELVIGMTIVAFGTSLPELATTIVAARKGQADLAVGNAVGSNLFNVLVVLGITAIIAPLSVREQALSFDIPFMMFGCFAVWLLMLVRPTLRLPQGIMMVAAYGVYIFLSFTLFKNGVVS